MGLRTSHTTFCVVFPLALYAACNALNFDKLTRWFISKDGTNYVGLFAYLLSGLCLFIAFFALLAHRRTIKPLAILITVMSGLATYFIAKYNVAIDGSMMLNVVHTDATEVGQLLSTRMLPYFVFLMFLPALLIIATDITFRPAGKYLLGSASSSPRPS